MGQDASCHNQRCFLLYFQDRSFDSVGVLCASLGLVFGTWAFVFGLCLLAFPFQRFWRFCIGRSSAEDLVFCVVGVWAFRLGFRVWASVFGRQHLGKCLGFSRLGFWRFGF